jgi:hypothetical protein
MDILWTPLWLRYLTALAGAWHRHPASAPFDVLRAQHAAAVQCGAAPRSLLASARFEHKMDWLEHASLGQLARSR